MINKLKFALILFVFAAALNASSTKFGLTCNTVGNIYEPYSTAGLGRSFEIASTDSFHLNARNFSMWTNILASTFAIGLDYHVTSSYNGETNDILDDWYLQNILIAAPIIRNKVALGIGVQPATQINQHVFNAVSSEEQDIEEHMFIRGGIGRAFINAAYQIIPQIGIGLAYEYNFGNMQSDYRLEFKSPVQTSLILNLDSRTSGSNFVVSANATPFTDLSLGFVWRAKMDLEIARTAESNSEKLNQKSTIMMRIPAEYNFGIQYLLLNRWVLGGDFVYQDWENGFLVEGQKTGRNKPYYRIGVGFERKNSGKKFDKYYRKIVYRGGLFYDQKMHKSNHARIQEYGLSYGMGFPLIWNRSKFEASLIIGRRGDISINQYEETFMRLSFSITVGEIWFQNPEE